MISHSGLSIQPFLKDNGKKVAVITRVRIYGIYMWQIRQGKSVGYGESGYQIQCCTYIKYFFVIGHLGVGITGRVELALTMKGMWEKAFGLRYLSFGNIKAGIAIEPAVAFPGLGKGLFKPSSA